MLERYAELLCTSETRFGQVVHFREDDPIGLSLARYGEWAQLELHLLLQLLRPGDHVVDIGANVGTHTLAFAAGVGSSGRVLAFEPQPVIHAILARNVAANGLSNVSVEQCALSDILGTVRLAVPDYREHHNSGAAKLSDSGVIEVGTKRLDDFSLERCALLKLDVEGYEKAVLAGAAQTLQRCRPLVYAECNTLSGGWTLINALADSYVAWLHAPYAFNPSNHRGNPVNHFGIAQETSLLFVPKDRAETLRPVLQQAHGVSEVPSLEALATAWSLATRFGEEEVRPERTRALARRVAHLEQKAPPVSSDAPVRNEKPTLKRKIHVLVPVYNGYGDFEQLAHSLFASYPDPDPNLRFVFIDDASPDPRVGAFLASALFDREDVVRLANPRNLGFIGTVNRGLELYSFGDQGTDVVILNSDTQIHGNVFAILQDVADRVPNVASVTPMTNSGTIASLWEWPNGGELPKGFSPRDVALAVEQARQPTTYVNAPTGIGFCMYMTKQALDMVGGFDPIFGKGYGEENHWCQTAAKRGFLNVLTTEAFVYHHGSQSFGDDLKRRQLERNMSLLNELHPTYLRDVHEYIDSAPLRRDRARLLWAIRRDRKRRDGLHTVLFVLHNDPAHYAGGTERHVMALTEGLLAAGRTEVMHLYAGEAGTYVLNVYLPSVAAGRPQPFSSQRFDRCDAFSVMQAIAPEVDTLHVHHLLGWPSWFTQLPALFAHSRKLVTLHDYYTACPSIRLMSNGKFCEIPADLRDCNNCLTAQHGYRESTIEDFRGTHARFLRQFDRVLVPSEAAKQTLLRAFHTVSERPGEPWSRTLGAKVEVVSNFLPEAAKDLQTRPSSTTDVKRVIYLGAFVEPKGGHLFAQASGALLRKGFTLEVWGALGHPLPQGATHRTYSNVGELRRLAAEFPATVVVIPAVWPETFSFTTFEAVLDVGAPVVVGPYGNPPEVVRDHQIGVVLKELTPERLAEAVEQCAIQRDALVQHFAAFRAHAAQLTVQRFIERVYETTLVAPPERSLMPLERLVAPSNRRIVHVSPPAPGEPPLRHRLIDNANAVLKERLPFIHQVSKRLAGRRGGPKKL